ncbi:MAG: phosphoribosylamine--glycine ligase, partial [Rhodospirillales bacterium]
MKVLVVGSGGREHALAWAISRSAACDSLYCAPGNAGMAEIARCRAVAADDIAGLVALAKAEAIDFVVVGPEAPLVAGLVDRLEDAGIAAFGPKANAAVLEGSKGFMKDLCSRYEIPTAAWRRFDEPEAAKEYIHRQGAPLVVKADGLAAGKGVILCRTDNEAYAAIDHILIEGAFGEAGAQVIIEEFLEGEEASFFALVHGTQMAPLASAQDHKAAFDGDEGPNTGGMGAYSPAPAVPPEIARTIMDRIMWPTVRGMAAEGRPYSGVLYAGVMITREGPKLLEFNVRFGD